MWFGPGPNYDSYIVDDPNSFVVTAGKKTNLNLNEGTYTLKCYEVCGTCDQQQQQPPACTFAKTKENKQGVAAALRTFSQAGKIRKTVEKLLEDPLRVSP